MSLSRREFLQAAGITAASASLFGFAMPGIRPGTTLAAPQIVQGRALQQTHIVDRAGQVMRTLWADAVFPIREYDADWYATEGGLVTREQVQPIAPYPTEVTRLVRRVPADVEVTAPVAAVRGYAAADAPLVTRVGHGGVMQVADVLTNAGGTWYAVADADADPIGWTQAAHWRRLDTLHNAAGRRDTQAVTIDRTTNTLTATSGSAPVLQTAITAPASMAPGAYTLHPAACGGVCEVGTMQRHGTPYHMVVRHANGGTIPLHGAYWHNRFGHNGAGNAVELNVLAAKWLYLWAQDETTIKIV